MRDARNIINSLKERLGVETDKDLASLLGLSASSLTMQIKRNSLDWNHLFRVLVDTDLNWLVRGTSLHADIDTSRESDLTDCERQVQILEAKIEVYREIVHELSQGKGPASITLTPSKEPVKSS